MTQIQAALKNKITPEMRVVAKAEDVPVGLLKKRIAKGLIVILANPNHQHLKPLGIGLGLRVKVNANIGTSPTKSNLKTELKKLDIAVKAGADTIMDLSISRNADKIRQAIIRKCRLPLGTVPIYQAVLEAGQIKKMNLDIYLQVLEKQAREGVDFVTVHAGVTRAALPLVQKRLMKCVSRGGSFLLAWMRYHKKENFLYQGFGEILKIVKQYDITLSLGDGLRPGCLADATDQAQIQELKILGQIAKQARGFGVQVMIEGPGHIPLNEIEKNVRLEKKYCLGAPFYVLGPLPTDIAARL